MKIKTLIFLTCFCKWIDVVGQTTLVGAIDQKKGWAPYGFILRLDHIDIQSPNVVDTIDLSIQTINISIKENTDALLYKIVIPPEGGNAYSTIDGHDKNFILFSSEDKMIEFSADVDSLYYSLRINEGNVNRMLSHYIELRKPLYHLSLSFMDSVKLHPEKEELYRKSLINPWMSEIETFKKKVTMTLDTATNESMILAGLFYLHESYLGLTPGVILNKYVQKVNRPELAIVQNIKALANDLQSNRKGLILPDVEIDNLQHQKKSLKEVASQYTVIDFWASWCRPCRQVNKEELRPFYDSLSQNNKIVFHTVSIDENEAAWRKAVEQDNIPGEPLLDGEGTLRQLLSVHAVPLYIVLDKDRRIIYETISFYQLKTFLRSL